MKEVLEMDFITTMIDSIPIAGFFIDHQEKVITCNHHAKELLRPRYIRSFSTVKLEGTLEIFHYPPEQFSHNTTPLFYRYFGPV